MRVAVLPANDLRGLAGEPTIDLCTRKPEPKRPVCRWVGGLGHELGHALGVPHPHGYDTRQPWGDERDLMWFGFTWFPQTYWNEQALERLGKNPLFGAMPVQDPGATCPDP